MSGLYTPGLRKHYHCVRGYAAQSLGGPASPPEVNVVVMVFVFLVVVVVVVVVGGGVDGEFDDGCYLVAVRG